MPLVFRPCLPGWSVIALLGTLSACGGATVNGVAQTPADNSAITSQPILGDQSAVSDVDVADSVAETEESSTSSIETPVLVPTPGASPAATTPVPAPAASVVAAEPPPATPEPREYTVADITDLILVTGQSNALGADTSFDPVLDSPHQRVFAFTESGWATADLHQVWDLGWFPRGNIGGDPSNNFAFHVAKEMAYRQPDRVIGFVLASAPGEGIDHWDTGDAFFAEVDIKVLDAINQLPHKSGVDGILWHQGESDEGDYQYGDKLNQLIANFRQQNWFAANRPFICGETAEFTVVNRQLMALNGNGDRWSACVDGAGLQTREDGYHFDAAGLRELGRRYAIKYLSLTR